MNELDNISNLNSSTRIEIEDLTKKLQEISQEISLAKKIILSNQKHVYNFIKEQGFEEEEKNLNGKIRKLKDLDMEIRPRLNSLLFWDGLYRTYGKEVIDKTLKSYAKFHEIEVSDVNIKDILDSSAGIEGWIEYMKNEKKT